MMTRKVMVYVLLLLVCGSVAAEPVKKSAKTTAVHPSKPIKKSAKTTAVHPSALPKEVKSAPKGPPANQLFGGVAAPAPLAARAIGSYAKGCLAGAVSLPINGPAWQVMRLSRDRNWGHPRLLDFLERFAADARTLDGWPGLLVGDMSQPRGGPMITGHSSHQVGLDVDLWLTPMPDRTLTVQEREDMIAESMLKDPLTVDRDKWTPLHTKLIKRAVSYPEVARVFVHPAIKKVLCEQAGNDRAWLTKVRPWWNHYYHFHVRISCPPEAGDCENQNPVSSDDGCGQELTHWYAMLTRAAIAGAGQTAIAGAGQPPPKPAGPRNSSLTMANLPPECGTVLTAGGFEPVRLDADTMPGPVFKALASKEAGPPPPKLDAAALEALIAREAGMSLPARNPKR